MKSYLSLIPISAKVNRKSNRMTLWCIIFAVFLVTAIFSLADLGVSLETARLTEKHGAESVTHLMSHPAIQTLYGTAFMLFILVLIAGVLMISGSIHSNVAQRTQFFGMLRCIGMSQKQLMRFVRLEALNWCKVGIPVGVGLGVFTTWGLSLGLKYLVGGEFSQIPILRLSWIGIVSGVLVGLLTVLVAAHTPAKKASKVSPIQGISGQTKERSSQKSSVKLGPWKIETGLGIHHGISSKKNFFLIISSFALSIVLFLSFSSFVELVGYLMPQSVSTPDINIVHVGEKDNQIIPQFVSSLEKVKGVSQVYGRQNLLNLPVSVASLPEMKQADLISFGQFDLESLEKDKRLKKGSHLSDVLTKPNHVLGVWDPNRPLQIGEKITIQQRKVRIAGLLKVDPFSEDGSVQGNPTFITSYETFTSLTGITGYSLISLKTTSQFDNQSLQKVSQELGDNYQVLDVREQNTTSTYLAFNVFIYGFLLIIGAVTFLNIINSISLSVSARLSQFATMRAVGMDMKQVSQVILAEAMSYGVVGGVLGCVVGVWLNKFLFDHLIGNHFAYAQWNFPVGLLAVVFIFVMLSVLTAVYFPVKRIEQLSVTEHLSGV